LTTTWTFLTIIDTHTVVVTLLAVVSTYLALSLELGADMPADLISVAVIFPIVFSINAAYTRFLEPRLLCGDGLRGGRAP
jgi:predicted membrane chloride channel (bestrophin family)